MEIWAALPRWPNGYQKLKQAFSNVNWQNKLKFEKLGSASAVTQWLPELKTSFLYVDQECYNF